MNFFIFIRFYNFTKNGRAHFLKSATSQQPYWNWTSSPAGLYNFLRDFTTLLFLSWLLVYLNNIFDWNITSCNENIVFNYPFSDFTIGFITWCSFARADSVYVMNSLVFSDNSFTCSFICFTNGFKPNFEVKNDFLHKYWE